MASFLAELKRRNVYKVAVAYAVVAWLLIQAASILFPTFEAPAWVMKVFVAAIAAGFPIALVIAWAFELTPEGLKRSDEVRPHETRSWRRGRFAGFVGVFAISALALLAYRFLRDRAPASGGASSEKSVAVLPFENFNRDPENAYFADGIQDEILTRLAKIDDLKVISRTSTQRYKASPENLPVIAKQLGVAHVLEGSVQKAGDQVRVTVQLIRAATDSHVWAETYDRKLTDIFAVESEIAEKIAKSLRAKLTPGERKAVAERPTENPEAYDAFLRGLAIWNGLSLSPENLEKMVGAYSRAVELDPNFAIAWANLAVVQTLCYAEFDPTAARLAEAKRTLDQATKLQPDSGDTFFALGLYRYRALRDFDKALEAFQQAFERGVNRALSLEFAGYVKRRQGKWDEALSIHAQSAELDPRNSIIFSERAVTYRSLRRFGEAFESLDRALALAPDNPLLFAQKAVIYQAAGDFDAAGRLVERLAIDRREAGLILPRYTQLMCARKYTETAAMFEHLLEVSDALPVNLRAAYRARLGYAKRLAGDADGATGNLRQAREMFEKLRKQSVDGEGFLDQLIVLEGMLGDRAAVESHAAKLQDNIAKDAYAGPSLELAVAAARSQLGQTEAAVTILRGLLLKPGEDCITPALLRADPAWDSLRSDARFQELASGKP